MALPVGHNHVCSAAFITTISAADRILTPGNTSLDALTMIDRHVAHRNLHLVPSGAKPIPPPAGGWRHEPQTVILDFHNALREEAEIDVVVNRRDMAGPLTMMLTTLQLADSARAFDGWRVTEHGILPEEVVEHVGLFLQRLGEAIETLGDGIEQAGRRIAGDLGIQDEREMRLRKLEGIDRTVVYVADPAAVTPTISGIRLPPAAHNRRHYRARSRRRQARRPIPF